MLKKHAGCQRDLLMMWRLMVIGMSWLMIGVATVDASLEHRWSLSGYAELRGFASENEPVKTEASSDDTGATMRLNLGISYAFKDYLSARVNLVTEGASRYGLVLGNDHHSYYGTVESAGGSDFVPFVDTAELLLRNTSETLWCRAGLIRPHRFGKYALPGAQLGGSVTNLQFNIWYVDAGKRDRWHRPEIQLEDGLTVHDSVDASFWGAGISGDFGNLNSGIEVTLLEDRTPSRHRWNAMSYYWGRIAEDSLGTITLSATGQFGAWSAEILASSNFGRSTTTEGHDYRYAGKRVDASLAWQWGSLAVKGRFLYQSGAKFPHPDSKASDNKYKGFSYYPPTNGALYDSHYFRETGPPVLLGSNVTPFYGVPRPNQHYDMSSSENLKAGALRVAWDPVSTLSFWITAWKLKADEVYWVLDSETGYFKPSDDLGWEFNANLVWNPIEHITINAFSGIMVLGDFFQEIEDYYPYGLSQQVESFWIGSDTIHLTELGVTVWF